MTRKKTLVFILILLMFAASYVLLNKDSIFAKKENYPYEISVICRSQDTEAWTTMKLGIDQAATDLNADVSFITLSSANNVAEQISLLNREVDNGANAVVIAPINSTDLKVPIEQAAKKVPIIAMQSTVTGLPDLQTVSCDNYEMGQQLATELVQNENNSHGIVILRNSMGCSNIDDCFRGVENILKISNYSISFFDIPDDADKAYNAAKQRILSEPDGIYVAMDGETLEAVAKAKKDLSKSTAIGAKIYGVGRTNNVVSLLEEKVISAIAVDNEYNIGYLCIKSAVDSIQGKSDGNTNVNFIIVNNTNMYESESERMLFPFVR
jgi:ribose transport system substrate-binding protein